MSLRDLLPLSAFDDLKAAIDVARLEAEQSASDADSSASQANDSSNTATSAANTAVEAADSINAGIYLVDEGDDFFELGAIAPAQLIEETITVEGFQFETILIQTS